MTIEFKKTLQNNPGTLMLVDGLNLAFRYKHSGKTDFVEDYIMTVKSLAKSYKASNVVICCDGGTSLFRSSIYPEYKANRKDKFESQSQEELDKFKAFIEEYNNTIQEIIRSNIFPVLKFTKVEADDIAAYIVKNKSQYGIDTIWLISSDKDWDLLIRDNVNRFSYVTRKEITKENWHDHYDIPRVYYIDYKCLVGDTGDNIKGVELLGPVTATKVIKQYGDIHEIAETLPIDSKYKYIKNLNAFGKEGLLLNNKLMNLIEYCDEAIGTDNCKVIDDTINKLYKD